MKFDIYAYNKLGSKVYITQFDPNEEQHNLYSTFNEKINHADNDQITLTFSIARKVLNGEGEYIINPFLKYLVFGATVCVEADHFMYELIISQIAPKTSKGNTIYDITCQDILSYKWPRINLGYSYNTMDHGGVQTIYEITGQILKDCNLENMWNVKETNNHLYPNDNLKNERITVQVENSNPYNAIIEALNALNASMLVNYRTHELRFYQKDRVLFSGYRYRPEINLRSLSANYNMDELATILHVVGGTDEKDMNVMLVPPVPMAVVNYLKANDYNLPSGGYAAIPKIIAEIDIPTDPNTGYVNNPNNKEFYDQEVKEVLEFCTIANKVPSLGQFLYNFDFFRQNGLMTESQYNDIINIFNVDMARLNMQLKPLLLLYYNSTWSMQKKLYDVESELEKINAAYKAQIDGTDISFTDDIATATNNIEKLLQHPEFANNYSFLYGYDQNPNIVAELEDILDKAESYIALRKESRLKYDFLQEEYKVLYSEYFEKISVEPMQPGDYEKTQLQGEILYYKNKYNMSLLMCGNATTRDDIINYTNTRYNLYSDPIQSNASSEDVDSFYGLYYKKILDQVKKYTAQSTGIMHTILTLEEDIQELWSKLYTEYGQFIYEATYENADELDSISLYNQAVAYFEDYHHPKSSYSVEILNLDDLEQVGVPNLKINSRIRIYNEDLGLNEGNTYISGEKGECLNNISYTNNELIITALNYDLRKSAAMSITVEKIIQHQMILQKLIKGIR